VLTLTLFTVALGRPGAPRIRVHPEPHGSRIAAPQTVTVDEPARDVYGNDITQAVATYKLDSTGTLYEEHSPQTEVPRLGSPKS
jgi:hypothetical protein